MTVNGGVVKNGDVEFDNGVVHVVDKVLFPPVTSDIFETLKSDPEKRFTTFIKALKATKLDREIKDFTSESSPVSLIDSPKRVFNEAVSYVNTPLDGCTYPR